MQSPSERFWSKVQKTETCWKWQGGKHSNGYGRFYPKHDVEVGAHEFAYTLQSGAIPEGKELDHLCKNRDCVNPSHLEPVTHHENLLRGATIPAKNAVKTHCIRGHPLEGDNLTKAHLKNGQRHCRQCHNLRRRKGFKDTAKAMIEVLEKQF